MLNFDKTDLKDNVLMITNDDGSIKCIPEEGCTAEEKALFDEFRAKYPNGKPVEVIEQEETPIPQLSEMDKLKQQLADLENYILQREVQNVAN